MRRVGNWWKAAGHHPLEVFLLCFSFGALLCISAWLIGIGNVSFDGRIGSARLHDTASMQPKEVGFLWAPNWGIASLFLIPVIVMLLAVGRVSMEDALSAMLDRGMLRKRKESDSAIDILQEWERHALRWMWYVFPLVFGLLFLIIMIFDFIPVVFNWLYDPDTAQRIAPTVYLNHSEYEFDWSVAAVFPDAGVHWLANAIFSFVAYLWVPFLASAFIVSSFLWFLSLPAFLGRSALARRGYELVPDWNSDDRRKGYEVMESFFNALLAAAIITAVLALAMHLQNVYLRAPGFANLPQMVFGSILNSAGAQFSAGATLDVADRVKGTLLTVSDAMQASLLSNLQVMLTAFGLMLLVLLVAFGFSAWLLTSAKEGRAALRAELKDEPKEVRRALSRMHPWPSDLITWRYFFTYMGLILVSMFWVNFLAVVLVTLAVNMAWVFSSRLWRRDPDEEDA